LLQINAKKKNMIKTLLNRAERVQQPVSKKQGCGVGAQEILDGWNQGQKYLDGRARA